MYSNQLDRNMNLQNISSSKNEELLTKFKNNIESKEGSFLGMFLSLFRNIDSVAVDVSTFNIYTDLSRLEKKEFQSQLDHLVDFYSTAKDISMTETSPYAEKVSFISHRPQVNQDLTTISGIQAFFGICEVKVHYNILHNLSMQTLSNTANYKLAVLADNALQIINLSDLLTDEEYTKLKANIDFNSSSADKMLLKVLDTNLNINHLKKVLDLNNLA